MLFISYTLAFGLQVFLSSRKRIWHMQMPWQCMVPLSMYLLWSLWINEVKTQKIQGKLPRLIKTKKDFATNSYYEVISCHNLIYTHMAETYYLTAQLKPIAPRHTSKCWTKTKVYHTEKWTSLLYLSIRYWSKKIYSCGS